MKTLLYSRVSTDQQEHEETILSQLAELRARAKDDGLVAWDRSVARYTGSKPAPRDPYPFNVNFHHILRPALRPGDATVAQPLI